MVFGVVSNMNYVFIGDVFKVSSGGTPNRKKPEYFSGGTIPWVKTGELKGKFANKPSEFITQTALENSSAKLFPPKTVLLAMYGATIGACSILDFEAATNQACAAILPSEDCDEVYLYYYLSSIKPSLVSKGVGGAQPNISAGLIKKIKIPLPPLEEQKKIAAILDAADKLRQKEAQLIEKYNALSQSLFLDMFGDLGNFPQKILNNVVQFIDYRGKTPTKVKSGIPLLTAKNVKHGYISVEPREYLAKDDYSGWMTRGFPCEGDVLFTTEAPLGQAALLPKYEKVAIAQRLICLQPNSELNAQFLLSALLSNFFKQQLFNRATGSTVKGIRSKELAKTNIPIPPITLQNQFAERIQHIEAQKQQAQAALQKSYDLFNSLLQRAFKGELTQENEVSHV